MMSTQRTTNGLQWTKFNAAMLDKLPPGNYPLRQKISVTPPVPDTHLCPLEDQLLFSAVDDMERDLLNTVIQAKIRDLNKGKVRILISQDGTATAGGLREQKMVIIDINVTGKRLKTIVKNLAELLAMAYDQILIKIPSTPSSSTNVTGVPNDVSYCLQDHNCCEGDSRHAKSTPQQNDALLKR